MATFRSHVSALFRRAVTIPKLLIMALGVGFSVACGLALKAFIDVAKDKAETYATDWAANIFQNQTAQRLLAHVATLAVRYPTTAVVAVFLFMLLLIVVISAIQIRSEVHATSSVATPSPNAAITVASREHLRMSEPEDVTATFVTPIGGDRELLADHEFLEDLNQRWRLTANAYQGFIEGWNAYVGDIGVFIGRPGLLKPSIDRLNSAHASFIKRVKQFAASLLGEEESRAIPPKQVPFEPSSDAAQEISALKAQLSVISARQYLPPPVSAIHVLAEALAVPPLRRLWGTIIVTLTSVAKN
jgi:hypothetical protein